MERSFVREYEFVQSQGLRTSLPIARPPAVEGGRVTTKWDIEFDTSAGNVVHMVIASRAIVAYGSYEPIDEGLADEFALAVMGAGSVSVRRVTADCREYRRGDPTALVEARADSRIGPWVKLQRWRSEVG